MLYDIVLSWLIEHGFPAGQAPFSCFLLLASGIFITSLLANFAGKRYLLAGISYLVEKSKNKWDDVLLEQKVFNRLSHFAPALVIYLSAGLVFPHSTHGQVINFMERGALVYMYVVGAMFLFALLNTATDIYQQFNVAKNRPIKGYIQAIKLMLLLVTAILAISTTINQSPKLLLSGIGALTAVLLLVFKDTILGFVAGIQLASNNMVRPGDWISVPKKGADGDVIDVSLTTVKVQNWDKTITTIPIYSLIADSFTNWRGMSESGGRRIKRSFCLDMTSIRFCDEEMLNRFAAMNLLTNYIQEARDRIGTYHKEHNIPDEDVVNAPRLTNIGTFRVYVTAYLQQNPMIHKNMTFLVRQLAPTEHGLPLEIYVFSKDQAWANYEGIQADIFDHLLAVLPEFSLRIFQSPSGYDFRSIIR